MQQLIDQVRQLQRNSANPRTATGSRAAGNNHAFITLSVSYHAPPPSAATAIRSPLWEFVDPSILVNPNPTSPAGPYVRSQGSSNVTTHPHYDPNLALYPPSYTSHRASSVLVPPPGSNDPRLNIGRTRGRGSGQDEQDENERDGQDVQDEDEQYEHSHQAEQEEQDEVERDEDMYGWA
jgi:hypothetical protein